MPNPSPSVTIRPTRVTAPARFPRFTANHDQKRCIDDSVPVPTFARAGVPPVAPRTGRSEWTATLPPSSEGRRRTYLPAGGVWNLTTDRGGRPPPCSHGHDRLRPTCCGRPRWVRGAADVLGQASRPPEDRRGQPNARRNASSWPNWPKNSAPRPTSSAARSIAMTAAPPSTNQYGTGQACGEPPRPVCALSGSE